MWYQGYVDKLGEDGRLRASYRHGTVTSGRLSVERVQLQAMPKADKIEEGVVGVRDLLRAKKGYGLWSLDMQQAELRVAAHYSGCARLLEMLAEGRDVHGETTQQVLGVQPDAPDYKLKRDIGKRLTFSSLFGIGGKHFHEILKKMADIDLPISECDILVKRWRDMYPEITHAYRKCDRHMQERGWVRILPGTEYETKSWLAPHEYPNTGWNRMVQGSLAAWLRMWLVAVDEEWPDTLVLTVHDSIALELPKKTGARIAKEVAEFSAERATALFGIPMPVEVDRYA
jgi:DNA polymerase-1